MGLILLDTNIIIYLSKRELSTQEIFFKEDEYAISLVTYMEVLGFEFQNSEEERFVKKLLSYFTILSIEKEIADQTVELRKKYKIKLSDAIICATAIVNDAILITNDLRLDVVKEVDIIHIKKGER